MKYPAIRHLGMKRLSKRQMAKERRYERRVWDHQYKHGAAAIRVIHRGSYPEALAEVRESRALRPDCRFLYLPSFSGNGYTVVELLRTEAR